MNRRLRMAIGYVLLSTASVATVYGQAYQGGVRGFIGDKQGAALPGAQVTLIDEAKKVTRATVTNSDGQYVFTAVEPATYTISIEATGFRKLEQKSMVVGTQQFLTLDFHLEIGSVNQRVEVSRAE